MGLTEKRIAILVHNYFEQAEFEKPLRTLKNAGAAVAVISTDRQELQGLHHIKLGDKFQADLLLEDANQEDFDALVLPGGALNADKLRMIETARFWVVEFLKSKRIVAAICHAPWLLVSSGVISGRKLTSYYTIQDDVRNAGGNWVDEEVVVDDNLVTSRQPDDLPAFNAAIINALNQQQPLLKSM